MFFFKLQNESFEPIIAFNQRRVIFSMNLKTEKSRLDLIFYEAARIYLWLRQMTNLLATDKSRYFAHLVQ